MFEYIYISQARTHASLRWEWLSKEQSWSMELAWRHRTALNRNHWGVVAHGHSSWKHWAWCVAQHKHGWVPVPLSCHALRDRAFSHKLEAERSHLPCQAICQLVQRGHLPPLPLLLSHHVSLTDQGDDSSVPMFAFCVRALQPCFLHLLLPGAIYDARKKGKA